MDMDKDVLIAIKGMQELDGLSGEGDELVTPGTYSMDGNIARFSYMESELTGMEGTKPPSRSGPPTCPL